MPQKILIIDDEQKLRKLMSKIIELEGFEVYQSGDLHSGKKLFSEKNIDMVICDVKLPDGNGLDAIEAFKKIKPNVEIIMITAYGNINDGVKAIKRGAFDYITKGDDNNKIIPLVHQLSERIRSKSKENISIQSEDKKSKNQPIIGNSSKIHQAISLAEKVASTQATVLLTGETGTGKEVFAQYIHQQSNKRSGNFVAINCAAFSKELLESELFGHRSGSFTGANKDQKGLFEQAHGGTIFLDEVGEIPINLQAKILRVLELGEFIRIGNTQPTKVDVRIIAATNRNLAEEVANGNFREDLFYRLSVFNIELPPLRDRKEDIVPLAEHFVHYFCQKNGISAKKIDPSYIEPLKKYHWKGNVRELRNTIEYSVILSESDTIDADCLPPHIQENTFQQQNLGHQFSMASVEKKHIQKMLDYTNGNKSEAARLLEIGVATLYRKIEEYQLK